MFGTKEKQAPTGNTQAPARKPSTVAEGLSVTGDIQGEGDLRIDGRLDGSVACRNLTVGRTGGVFGRIKADTVIVEGRIEGEVEARSVTLRESAHMLGDVDHEVISVEAGAVMEGRYSRRDGAAETKGKAVLPGRQETKVPKGRPPKDAKDAEGGGKPIDIPKQQDGIVVGPGGPKSVH